MCRGSARRAPLLRQPVWILKINASPQNTKPLKVSLWFRKVHSCCELHIFSRLCQGRGKCFSLAPSSHYSLLSPDMYCSRLRADWRYMYIHMTSIHEAAHSCEITAHVGFDCWFYPACWCPHSQGETRRVIACLWLGSSGSLRWRRFAGGTMKPQISSLVYKIIWAASPHPCQTGKNHPPAAQKHQRARANAHFRGGWAASEKGPAVEARLLCGKKALFR